MKPSLCISRIVVTILRSLSAGRWGISETRYLGCTRAQELTGAPQREHLKVDLVSSALKNVWEQVRKYGLASKAAD